MSTTPMTKIRDLKEEFLNLQMVELTYGNGEKYKVSSIDPKVASQIADWFINRFQQELEKATRCQKPVENGEAICGCKLDCHLHDWRQKEMLMIELSSLEGEIIKYCQDYYNVQGYLPVGKDLKEKVLEIIRQHKERYEK